MNVAIRVAVILMMTVVGLGLTIEDFRRLRKQPRLGLLGTTGQWLLLPLAAWAVAWSLPLPPNVVAGMILVVGSPAGAISNYYSYLARADAALSVSLTAVTSVASLLTMPLIVGIGFKMLIGVETDLVAPYGAIISQLLLVVLAPVAVGMTLRYRFPSWAERHQQTARRISQVTLVIVVALVVVSLRGYLLADLWLTVLSTVAFTVLAGAAGVAAGKLAGANPPQITTLIIEFACRNTAIPILVSVAILDRPDLAVFALVFFLTQMSLMLGVMAVAGRRFQVPPTSARI
jgi:BASS family bile acid:Na+ symporter